MRAVVYNPDDSWAFELHADELLGCVRDETINGERAVTITTTRKLSKGQHVLVRPDGGVWSEWTVEGIEEDHDTGTYYCPWSVMSDLTGIECDKMPGVRTPVSASEALSAALSGGKRWKAGRCTVGTVGGASMWHQSGWEALGTLVDEWGGELDVTVAFGASGVESRSVDLLAHMGSVQPVHRFEYARDVKGITRKVEDAPVFCRVVPRGKGEETEGGGSGRKIGIESVNGGKPYIEDPQAARAFRRPTGFGGIWEYPTVTIENSDIGDPAQLKKWALGVMDQYTTPRVSYEADVATLGFTPALGDVVDVVDHTFMGDGLRLSARVVRIVTNLLDETDTTVYVGNIAPGLQSAFSGIGAAIKKETEKVRDEAMAYTDEATAGVDKSAIDAAFDEAERHYQEVKQMAQAAGDRATTLAGQITEVETTINGEVMPGLSEVRTSVAGAVRKGDEALTAATTVTQTVNGIIAGTSQEYTNLVETLKRNSEFDVTPEQIAAIVTADYIDNKAGSKYIARTSTYQTADAIYTKATGQAKTYVDGQLESYTKTADLMVEGGAIVGGVKAILDDSGKTTPDPYIRASQLKLTEDEFSILFREGTLSGGVNLLLDTNLGTLTRRNGPYNRVWSNAATEYATEPAFVEIANPPVTGIEYGAKHVIASGDVGKAAKSLVWYVNSDTLPVLPLEDGEKYTLSCYCRRKSGSKAQVYFWVPGVGSKKAAMTKAANTWERLSYTFTYDEAAAAESSAASYRGRAYVGVEPTAAGTFELCGYKLEHGTVATDWSLNPIEYTAETLAARQVADRADARAVAYHGTCETAAATVEKVVNCANFKLSDGVTIAVSAKTAQNRISITPTINVNGTGAKPLYFDGKEANTDNNNQVEWGTGATVLLTYNASAGDAGAWELVGEPHTYHGKSTEAASTAAKTTTIPGMVLCKGTVIAVDMSNSNTATAPTMTISSGVGFGAKPIYAGTGTVRPMNSNGLGWTAGSTCTLVFDGLAFRMGDSASYARAQAASKTATNYLKFSSTDGLVVGDHTGSGLAYNVQILSNAINFRNNTEEIGHIVGVQSGGMNWLKIGCAPAYGGTRITGTNKVIIEAAEKTGISGASYFEASATTSGSGSTLTETDMTQLYNRYVTGLGEYISQISSRVLSNSTSRAMMYLKGFTSGKTAFVELTMDASGKTKLRLNADTVTVNGTVIS